MKLCNSSCCLKITFEESHSNLIKVDDSHCQPIAVRGSLSVTALPMRKQVFWYGQTAGLVLLVAEPEELLVLHYLSEAVS